MKSSLYLPLILVAFGGAWVGFVLGNHNGYIAARFWTCLRDSIPGFFLLGLGVEMALREINLE